MVQHYENALSLWNWLQDLTMSEAIDYIVEHFAGVNPEMARSFLGQSGADLHFNLEKWEDRQELLEMNHNSSQYRYGQWTALPATLAELTMDTNTFWWLYGLDVIPW